MPTSISDKLASLGVKVGTKDTASSDESGSGVRQFTVERVLAGRSLETQAGETYLIETFHNLEQPYGRGQLAFTPFMERFASWTGDERISAISEAQIAFLDIETTGLSGGTGTLAFLVGVGRYSDGQYQLAQFFLRDPSEEAAHLLAIEAFLAPCDLLVSFNGKSFDVPLLNTRYITHGWRSPFLEMAHIDLLHLARRLWRDRLPSRTLGTLEVEILRYQRSGEDIPGWMVPQMYFDYLHTGDARPLQGVIYHNAIDVLSMAALLSHTARILADPLQAELDDDLDCLALARLFADLGDVAVAKSLYRLALDGDLPLDIHRDGVFQLSMLYKRDQDWDDAIPLWQQAAALGAVEACEELAKYYEHQTRQYADALYWTDYALRHIQAPGAPMLLRYSWQADLDHRRQRLLRKLNPEKGI